MRPYERFDITGAMGISRYDSYSWLLDGEDWLLTAVDPSDRHGTARRKDVAQELIELQIAAAVLVTDVRQLAGLTKEKSSKFTNAVRKHTYFVGVPEADKLVSGIHAVAELEEIRAVDMDGRPGLLVNGVKGAGVLMPNAGRQLYTAARLTHADRPLGVIDPVT